MSLWRRKREIVLLNRTGAMTKLDSKLRRRLRVHSVLYKRPRIRPGPDLLNGDQILSEGGNFHLSEGGNFHLLQNPLMETRPFPV